MKSDLSYMEIALEEAKLAAENGEVPVGAVVVGKDGELLARAGNAPIATHDPTGHAEIRALRAAALACENYRLIGASLYVTLEPCAMCAGAIAGARIERLVIGARDEKGGAIWHGPKLFEQPTIHWRPEVIEGPLADKSSSLLKQFFRARRRQN